MARNTLIFVIILGIFAAMVVGVNVARMGTNEQTTNTVTQTQPTPYVTSIPLPTPIPQLVFKNDECGFSFSYPQGYTKLTLENGITTFMDPSSPIEATTVQCQNVLARQYPKGSTTSTIMIGSVSATLYTPPQATGSAQEKEKLYFRNPTKKKDIVISGSGETFSTILSTLTIQ